MPKTRALLTLVLVPLLAFLVACGGDDDGDSSNGSSSDSGDRPVATQPSGDAGSSGDSSSDDGGDDSSGDQTAELDDEAILENCPELVSFLNEASAGAFANPGTNPAEDLENLDTYLQQAADNAPDEISADFQILADAYTAFFGVLQEYEIDFSNPASFASLDAEAQAELQTALEAIGTDEVVQASENIQQWFEDNCSS